MAVSRRTGDTYTLQSQRQHSCQRDSNQLDSLHVSAPLPHMSQHDPRVETCIWTRGIGLGSEQGRPVAAIGPDEAEVEILEELCSSVQLQYSYSSATVRLQFSYRITLLAAHLCCVQLRPLLPGTSQEGRSRHPRPSEFGGRGVSIASVLRPPWGGRGVWTERDFVTHSYPTPVPPRCALNGIQASRGARVTCASNCISFGLCEIALPAAPGRLT